MHNYFTNYHTVTRFDTIVSSSGSLYSIPRQVTQVFSNAASSGQAVLQLVEALRYKPEGSQVRFPMVSLKFFIDIILPTAP